MKPFLKMTGNEMFYEESPYIVREGNIQACQKGNQPLF